MSSDAERLMAVVNIIAMDTIELPEAKRSHRMPQMRRVTDNSVGAARNTASALPKGRSGFEGEDVNVQRPSITASANRNRAQRD